MLWTGAVIIALVALAGRPSVGFIFPSASRSDARQLYLLLLATAVLLAATLFLSAYFALLHGLQRSDFGAYSALAGALLSAIATVTGIKFGLGIWALFIAAFVRSLVGWVGPFRGIRRVRPEIRPSPVRMRRQEAKALIGSSGLLTIIVIANLLDLQADKFVIARFSGPSASGLFQVGLTVAQQARSLALIPAGVLTVAAAELHTSQPERLSRIQQVTTRTTASVAVVLLGGATMLSQSFINIWLGDGYGIAGKSAALLSFAFLINGGCASWYYYAVGRGWYRMLACAAGIAAAINVAGSILLTPRLGAPGAAIGSLVAALIGMSAIFFSIQHREKVLRFRDVAHPFGAGAVAATVFVLLGFDKASTWPGFIESGLFWVILSVFALLISGAAPVRVSRSGPLRRRVRIKA